MVTGCGVEWPEGVERCKDDPAFNERVEEALQNLVHVEDGEPEKKRVYNPPSAVDTRLCCGEMTYVDVLFLSPQEVVRHTGGTAESLGLSICERTAEDGQSRIKGCYIRADDAPKDMNVMTWLSFRRVRLFCESSTLHAKKALQPQNQIQADQGSAMLTLMEKRRVAQDEGRPEVGKLHELKSLAELCAKQALKDDKKRQKEELISQALVAEGLNEPDPQPAEPVDQEKLSRLQAFQVDSAEAGPAPISEPVRKRKKQPPSNAGVSDAGVSGAGRSKAASKQGSAKVSQPGKSDGPSAGPAQEPDTILEALAHDRPMQKVALYLQTLPECIMQLSPSQAMQGVKLGNQTFAVCCLVCQCVAMQA